MSHKDESKSDAKEVKDEDTSSDDYESAASALPPSKSDDNNEENWLEKLQQFFSSKLKFNTNEEEIPKVLEDPTIDALVKYMKSGKCKNVITMAGAGISTSAGIPDFRSDEGLYAKLADYPVPSPESIFDIVFFRENPKPFFVLAKEIYPGSFNPTPAHYFIRLLLDKGLLLRHYTQNVDTLEYHAGIPAEKLVEAHGTFRTSHCLECNKEYTEEWVKNEIFDDKIPTCEKCSGIVKPDIVFFRESLPQRFFNLMTQDFAKCDLLIILGTSLSVQPFASIIDNVPRTCPRLLINKEKVGTSLPFMMALQNLMGEGGRGGGLQLDSQNNTRDLALIGGCDEGCRTLAEKLGWKDDLEKLIQEKSNL